MIYKLVTDKFRDELTERRRKMVEKAFRMMDRDGSGQLNIQDLSNNPPKFFKLIYSICL